MMTFSRKKPWLGSSWTSKALRLRQNCTINAEVPIANKYITQLVTLSMRNHDQVILKFWNVGRVILLPKPEKPTNHTDLYHYSLRSRNWSLLTRKRRSTVTTLEVIQDQIEGGLNQKKTNRRFIMVTIDLFKNYYITTITNSSMAVKLHGSTPNVCWIQGRKIKQSV